jgi:hypothetical protein
MIAELMVLNTAFKVIKTTISNGKELASAGKALSAFFGAEREVKKQLDSGNVDVMQAFQARREMAKAEADLKYLLNKESLLGYNTWLEFKAEYYREQREAEKLAARRKYQRAKALEENITIGLKVGGTLLLIMAALFGVALYLR